MKLITEQMKNWQGDVGKKYTERNLCSLEEMENLNTEYYGMSRSGMNSLFLDDMDRSLRILEIGCNIGNQLLCLQKMGFTDLSAVEIEPYAMKIAKARLEDVEIREASVFELPFKPGSFDLVFTSGVLIHISLSDIEKALAEIHRCTQTYIWGFEYYAETCEEIEWHGKRNMLWRNDIAKLYQQQFKDLDLVREKRFKYLAPGSHRSSASMFLLKKA